MTDQPDPLATSGLVVVDKPAGLTSHDVVARLRRILHTRKVGHAGTLDPMATGVLVCGVDRGTKLLGHLALDTKAYLATIRLGATTTTDDAEGETVTTTDPSAVTDEAIGAGIAALTGPILQVPSSVSAIKIDGRRAYARVRAGEQRERRDGHGPRRQHHLLPGPHPRVRPPPVDLDRADGAGHLQDRTGQCGDTGADRLVRDRRRIGRRDGLALGVVRGRRRAEPDRRRVRLGVERQVAQQLGAAADPADEDPGRHRVERAGVTDLAGAQDPP